MPRIHPHKVHGWQVVYRVWFPDGTSIDKSRFSKKKARAELIYRETSLLEDGSRRRELARKDILSYLNLKYISRAEADGLANAPLAVTWRELRMKYEDYSRRHCASYTHACNMNKVDVLMRFFETVDPNAITPDVVDRYIGRRLKETVEKGKPGKSGSRRSEPVKSATVEKEINTLRILMDPLGGDKRQRSGIWPENPARQVRPPKMLDERLPRPLWREDIGALRPCAGTERSSTAI